MNRILGYIVYGLVTGAACTIGMRLGEKVLEKVELQKTKDGKVIKIKA